MGANRCPSPPGGQVTTTEEKKMTTILSATAFLVAVLWGLLKLRELRERSAAKEPSVDKVTVLLGLFMLLSKACIRYHRDRHAYPLVISGSPEGLVELGYLEGELLAEMTSSIPLFSMAVSDRAGHGVCLAHLPANMATAMIRRAAQSELNVEFMDYRNGLFVPMTPPLSVKVVKLTLPLPLRPLDLSQEGHAAAIEQATNV